jgi:glyoxylase-like metal-dependent hydrolase (beta-lactamase superfamily II)
MQRRSFLQSSSLALPLPVLPYWIKLLIPPTYTMKLLRRNVGIFSERGGTIGWLIQPDGIVVVDAQFPEQAGHLIEEINKYPSAPMQYLINTHHHGDHTSGNIAFKGLTHNIVAHENSLTNQKNAAQKNGNEAAQLYPDITFRDRWQTQVGDEFIDIQYWGPAHTDGDSIIHFQHANIAHIGDLMFNRRYPFIDKSTGAMIENWIQILQQLQSYFDDDTIFIFGHAHDGYNVTGDKDDLVAFADYLTALMEFVSSKIKAGVSKDVIMAATEIPGNTQWTGDGIQRSLSAALEELGY